MRALITGGAGFIGSHLDEAIVKQGWKIVILDNLNAGWVSTAHKVRRSCPAS